MARLQKSKQAAVTTGQPKQPAFPARRFTAYGALSPGTGPSCPRRPQRSSRRRTWPQRREARTTRFCRPRRPPSSEVATASIAPRLTSRDDRVASLCIEAGWREETIELRKTEAKSFSRTDWTVESALNRLAKSDFSRNTVHDSGHPLRVRWRSIGCRRANQLRLRYGPDAGCGRLNSDAFASTVFSPPPCGEGLGVGVHGCSSSLGTPLPNPPPQGQGCPGKSDAHP
jgi:hypothetical protein